MTIKVFGTRQELTQAIASASFDQGAMKVRYVLKDKVWLLLENASNVYIEVYWDDQLYYDCSDKVSFIEDFEPAEFFDESRHIEYRIGQWLDDVESGDTGELTVGYEVVDTIELNEFDETDNVGWAFYMIVSEN